MARVDPERWAEKNIELVYIAGSVAEAARVEAALNEAEIDFTIGPEEFMQGVIPHFFGFTNTGAGFFVIGGQASHARTILRDAGLTKGLVTATE